MINEKAYEELSRNYRFFASWRHFAFAGGVTILAGVVKIAADYEICSPPFTLAAIGGVLAEVALLVIDARARNLTGLAVERGAELERPYVGFFGAAKVDGSWPRHTWAAWSFYVASSLVMIGSVIYCLKCSN